MKLPQHLRELENEAIKVIREVYANANNPYVLYSIGKDSTCLLELVSRAFGSLANAPINILHVDTLWKFDEMYKTRDLVAKHYGIHIETYTAPEKLSPLKTDMDEYISVMKTKALLTAITDNKIDMALCGARRDEEASRSKERVFSFRNKEHVWDPKNQRAELWEIYNTKIKSGESIRVFPLSNWTELDVWEYIHYLKLPVCPLYFAEHRPVIEDNGQLIVMGNAEMHLTFADQIESRRVRFRSLGCAPLSAAIESDATTTEDIINELKQSSFSERQGRIIDGGNDSMEDKKKNGYF